MLILTYPCNVPLDVFYIEIELSLPHTSTGMILIPVITDDEFSPNDPEIFNSLLFPKLTLEITAVESLVGIFPE